MRHPSHPLCRLLLLLVWPGASRRRRWHSTGRCRAAPGRCRCWTCEQQAAAAALALYDRKGEARQGEGRGCCPPPSLVGSAPRRRQPPLEAGRRAPRLDSGMAAAVCVSHCQIGRSSSHGAPEENASSEQSPIGGAGIGARRGQRVLDHVQLLCYRSCPPGVLWTLEAGVQKPQVLRAAPFLILLFSTG